MFLGTAVGREDPDQKSGRQQNGAPARWVVGAADEYNKQKKDGMEERGRRKGEKKRRASASRGAATQTEKGDDWRRCPGGVHRRPEGPDQTSD